MRSSIRDHGVQPAVHGSGPCRAAEPLPWRWPTRGDAHAVATQVGDQRDGIEQVLVARAEVVVILVIGLDAQLPVVAERVLDADDQVIRSLRAWELVDAVFDLQLVDARRLLIASPARAQPRIVAQVVQQIQTRAELLVRILDVGLLVPAHAQLGREPGRHAYA